MIDMRKVEQGLTLLQADEAMRMLIIDEYWKNGGEATWNLIKTLLIRNGIPRSEATTLGAAILVGITAMIGWVNRKDKQKKTAIIQEGFDEIERFHSGGEAAG